jgi:hypothetical protein
MKVEEGDRSLYIYFLLAKEDTRTAAMVAVIAHLIAL